jgi:hypothetical protein
MYADTKVAKLMSEVKSLTREEQMDLRSRITALIDAESRRDLRVGAAVQFKGRHGVTLVGRVIRVNPKTVMVEVDSGGRPAKWRVSPALLTVVDQSQLPAPKPAKVRWAKCVRAWPMQPLLKEGEHYTIRRDFFRNGETHYVLASKDGLAFEAPTVFLAEVEGE